MTKTNTHPDTLINKHTHTHIGFTMLLKLISLGGGVMSAEVMKMTTKRKTVSNVSKTLSFKNLFSSC